MKIHLKKIKEAETKLLERIAGQTIKLEKIKNGYMGVCPFCEKKTFHINTKNNRYRCLNCERKGSPIEFVMDFYHLDFEEAVRYLKNNYYL